MTAWDDPDASRLREAMTAEVRAVYSTDPTSQNRDGNLDIDPTTVVFTSVVHEDGEPVGHVALRRLGEDFEIKRMYVVPSRRGSDIAGRLLSDVEKAGRALGAHRLVLHTGDRQVAAIAFYQRHGYTSIPVYPPYDQLAYSLCFEKILS